MTTKNEKPSTVSLDDVLQNTEAAPEVDSETKALLEKLRAENAELSRKLEESKPKDISKVKDGDRIILHFLEDGFVACGQTWYRGQELAFTVGSEAYKQQQGRDGTSWLALVDSPSEQIARYGKQYFARGEWTGKQWGDTTGLSAEDARAAQQAAAREKSRSIEAPTLPKQA